MTRLLLDLDNAFLSPVADVDDGLALAMALGAAARGQLELAGVTSCGGNCRPAESARASLGLLAAFESSFGQPDGSAPTVPVAVGSDHSLQGDRGQHHVYLWSRSAGPARQLWDDAPELPLSAQAPESCPAQELILRLAGKSAPLDLGLMGSLTNPALALLADDALPARLGRVVHMGGVIANRDYAWSTPDIPDQVWRDVLRFNTLYDPMASAVVLEAGLDLTVVPANVTSRVLLRSAHLERIAAAGSVYHSLLAGGVAPWLAYSLHQRGLSGMHLHDPLALAVLLRPDLFAFQTMRVHMDRIYAGHPDFLSPFADGPEVNVVVDVRAGDAEAFIVDLICEPGAK